MSFRLCRAAILLFLTAFYTNRVDAQVPDSISVQGIMTDPSGTPLNATLNVTFRLYKEGTKVWEETKSGVVFSNGLFNEVLGTGSSLDDVAFDVPIELGIQVNQPREPELSPRTPLIPVPYALGVRGISSVWLEDPHDPGDFAFNIIGGSPLNEAGAGVIGVTVGGGGGIYSGAIERNVVSGKFGTIGGGLGNSVIDDFGLVAGGRNNSATGIWSVIGGGVANKTSGNASVVLGGYQNSASASGAVVGGGELNKAKGGYSVVPGGTWNEAAGRYSFAAGRKAKALHAGTFVWADSLNASGANFSSTGGNQFLVRASGGMGVGTNEPITQLRVVRSISAAAATSNHVALIDNTSTGTSADVLVLRVGRTTSPETSNSFVTFKFGSDETAGFIQGDGTGGIVLTSLGSDYAEFLPSLDAGEKFQPGDVVGVYGGRISHRTDGADKVMVVSTSPIVVGNMAASEDVENGSGTRIAFVGQAPVRVSGRVNAGDFLLPSGRHDGTAIAVSPSDIHAHQLSLVFATAWESIQSGGVQTVNAAFGIDESAAATRVIEGLHRRLDEVVDRLDRIEASVVN